MDHASTEAIDKCGEWTKRLCWTDKVSIIELKEAETALKDMKPWRAIGSTGVVVEMLGAGGKGCLESLKGIFNDMLFQNKLPNNWKLGSLALIYMGKIDPLNKNFYRNIKLLKHSFKLSERILDHRLREIVDIDKIQYGFMPGWRTVDEVFILRKLTEKYWSKGKKLLYGFVDLKKVFDRVSQKVIWYRLTKMYDLGVHQGSMLSPLLLVIVTDTLRVWGMVLSWSCYIQMTLF